MDPPNSPTASEVSRTDTELYYTIEDIPPWYFTIFLGFQHFMVMFGSTLAIPFILAPALCIGPDDPARTYLISTLMCVCGIVTLLQTSCGIRLPILQGGSLLIVASTLVILNLPDLKCPKDMAESYNITLYTRKERDVAWKSRMCEVQGAIIVAGAFEVLLGATGVIGLLVRFITPLVIAPVIALLGLSLVEVAANLMSSNWMIGIITCILLVIFSLYLRNLQLPLPVCNSKCGKWSSYKMPIFKLFPVLLTLIIMWILCYILTQTNVFSPDDTARTDLNLNLLYASPWFWLPYPFQWGFPIFNLSAGLGMSVSILVSVMESISDYFTCAKVSGAPTPPRHAINRGICVEGLGTIIAGILGSGNGSTSYTENVGLIGVTKVSSRRVLQLTGVILILVGLFAKLGACFATIPTPLVGGILVITFALITAIGLSQIQNVNMKSSRNLMVLGLPLLGGLIIPKWIKNNSELINTGNDHLDSVIQVLLGTSTFVGWFLGIILDNTVPGTKEDRGFTAWVKSASGSTAGTTAYPGFNYNFCFQMNLALQLAWTKYIPICPTFESALWSCKKKKKSLKSITSSEETKI